MSRLALHLFGRPHLERDGEPLEFDTRKIIALVAYLAVTGQPHTREALITLLWPELEPSRARAVLRRNLSLLRKALDGEWLVVDGETIGLDPDADAWCDVDQFRQQLAACEIHDHSPTEACPDCLPLLEEAVELYRDHFLAGFTLRDSAAFDEFQFFETEGLKDQLAGALVRLVTYHTSQGDFEPAISYARRWLALDSLHEPAHRRLMELYAQAGRHSAALRQYRTCLRTLEEELGVPPSAETTALYERIRAERTRPTEEKVAVPLSLASPAPLPAFLTEEETPTTVEKPVFVARERELVRLDGYLEATLEGQGQVVFVTGGPGRGKTALMHEFARQAMAAHNDLLVATGNCNAYSGVGDPYLPFREVLGMLTGDVESRWAAGTISRDQARRLWSALPRAAQALVDHGPSLIGALLPGAALCSRATAAVPQGAAWLEELVGLARRERSAHAGLEQSAIFQQVTNMLRAVAQAHPLLLLLDDVQWADSGSIGLLFHLGRRLEGGRILIACAYRPEEVALGRDGERHPLDDVLSEFKRRFGDVWVDLARVDETEGRRFVDGFLDTEPNRLGEDFRGALLQRTGGHPLFTVELLRAMQEREDLIQDEEGRWVEGRPLNWERLPTRVEAVVEARVGRLGDEMHDILAVASVEGERFTAQVIAQVQDIPEREVLRTLSQELGARHRLVREGEVVQIGQRLLCRYQFAHALFQAYLYHGLSAGERWLLHGEIAATLEGLYGDQVSEVVVQLAHHYDEARQTEKAIPYLLRAGDQARLVYANEEAIAYYRRALDLLGESDPVVSGAEPPSEPRKCWRLEALQGLGQVCYGVGEVAEAEGCFRGAVALGREMGLTPRALVRLYYWLGEAGWWRDRYDDVILIGEEGLALLGDDTESVEAALMNQHISSGHWSKGNWEKCQEFTHRTAQFIRRLPYSEELRPAYQHLILIAYRDDKDVEEAVKWVQAFEGVATQHHDLRALGHMHLLAAGFLAHRGDLHAAISRYQQALELSTRIGDARLESACLVFMEAFLLLGDLQKAEQYVGRGLETAKAVGIKLFVAQAHWLIGRISLCQGDWEKATDASRKAVQLFRETRQRWGRSVPAYLLGRAYLAQGDRIEALNQLQEAVALAGSEGMPPRLWLGYRDSPPLLTVALSGLEEAYEDPAAFRAFCHRFQEEHPQVGNSPFTQWFLEPTKPRHDFGEGDEDFQDLESKIQNGEWVWEDPFDDCSFRVQNGLEIHAANGRDLWHINWSAPRVLRPISGDLAVQTICVPASTPAPGGQKPAIGGLVLWKDRENYLRLDRGAAGEHEVFFGGCLENQDFVIGRGHLPSDTSGRVFLRLERVGERVDALCSADGESWFTVGHVEFPVEDPIQVGLHTIGNIDRTVYHGAYSDGTAIRFESFQLCELSPRTH